jgi:cytoskeletal protein RodZ
MAEKSPENNNIKKPEDSKIPEAMGLMAGIAGIIKKVRKSVADTLKGGGVFLKSGIKKLTRFFSSRLGYSTIPAVASAAKEILTSEKPKEKESATTSTSSAEKPETASPKLLDLPSGLGFVDKQGNSATPDKKIGEIVCKDGIRNDLSADDAPACTLNTDSTITVKPKDGAEKKYHLDTLLQKGDSYVAYLNTEKPDKVRVMSRNDLELFQKAA